MTMTLSTPTASHPRLRTAGALVAGFAAVFVLSSAADAVLHATGYYANDGTVGTDAQLAVALAYRTLFTIIGGAITAWLAPSRPLRLATILGAIGIVPAILGVVAMWGVGHQWYGISIAVLALPSTALGGWLFSRFAR
jgi:hypothetical protein